jgi:hypothetical protein
MRSLEKKVNYLSIRSSGWTEDRHITRFKKNCENRCLNRCLILNNRIREIAEVEIIDFGEA